MSLDRLAELVLDALDDERAREGLVFLPKVFVHEGFVESNDVVRVGADGGEDRVCVGARTCEER